MVATLQAPNGERSQYTHGLVTGSQEMEAHYSLLPWCHIHHIACLLILIWYSYYKMLAEFYYIYLKIYRSHYLLPKGIAYEVILRQIKLDLRNAYWKYDYFLSTTKYRRICVFLFPNIALCLVIVLHLGQLILTTGVRSLDLMMSLFHYSILVFMRNVLAVLLNLASVIWHVLLARFELETINFHHAFCFYLFFESGFIEIRVLDISRHFFGQK